MRSLKTMFGVFFAMSLVLGCTPSPAETNQTQRRSLVLSQSTQGTTANQRTRRIPKVEHREATPTVVLSSQEWRARLTPEQYKVLREEGTEMAWTGELLKNERHGVYRCAGCGNELFASDTKYDSKTGWPSYYAPVTPDAVGTKLDQKLRSPRTEVHCAQCGGHLGHVFTDGPDPTGLRYCINSVAMTFDENPNAKSTLTIPDATGEETP